MGVLDRLRQLDGDKVPSVLDAPAEPAADKEKVEALLGLMVQYIDHTAPDGFASTLYAIARRELYTCDEPKLDEVIVALVLAGRRLEALLAPGALGPAGVDDEAAAAG